MKNKNANVNTLRETSKGIYSNDKNVLLLNLSTNKTKKDCIAANEYMKLYEKILNM